MGVILYHFAPSPPSSAALLAARTAGVDIEIKVVDLAKQEQLAPGFLKINPQHTVPTLDDNGFIISESQAIASYLARKYSKNENFCPTNPKIKAVVDQRLYFDATTLWPRVRAISFAVFFQGKTRITDEQRKDINEALTLLETFLIGRKWLAGDFVTIADTAIYATVSFLAAIGWNISRFPAVLAWLANCKTLPGADENEIGAKFYGDAVKSMLEPGQVL